MDLQRETARLENNRRVWLSTPQEDLQGFSPEEVIERERQRLPLAVSGEAAMADCDCPLCQMMAESGPVFWNLDGSHMDEDFAFSFCRTYEEWESDHRGWEEFHERFQSGADQRTGPVRWRNRRQASRRGLAAHQSVERCGQRIDAAQSVRVGG